MLVNLYEILSVPDKSITKQVYFERQENSYLGETLIIEGVSTADMTISHESKDVVNVECKLAVNVKRSCARCLSDVEQTYMLDIQRMMNVAKKEIVTGNEEENETISYIEDCNLDVDMLILDELYTVLPSKVLCKEDCKGICKVCGTNLNKSTCNCDQTVPDPRMAVFSDIFNQFKEV